MNRFVFRAAVVVLCAAIATACTAPGPDPRFDDEAGGQPSCLKHQPQRPGPRYTDDAVRRTDDTLALLRYYTANAGKAYCDGVAPTETDREWAGLYVRLGADRKNVAVLLDRK